MAGRVDPLSIEDVVREAREAAEVRVTGGAKTHRQGAEGANKQLNGRFDAAQTTVNTFCLFVVLLC